MADPPSGIFPDPENALTRGTTLDEFVAAASTGDGVAVRSLEPLTALVVQTRNTRYSILIARGNEIVIQGGAFFPVPTHAHLDGASLGSSVLKLGWIGVGLRMEIRAGSQRIVTTPVRSIVRGEADSPSRPH